MPLSIQSNYARGFGDCLGHRRFKQVNGNGYASALDFGKQSAVAVAQLGLRMLRKIGQTVRVGKMGRNTLVGSAGLGFRALLQAGYLIALTRLLGPDNYGLLAGCVAAATLLAPLSGWGAGYVFLEKVSRDRSMGGGIWASVLIQTVLSGAMLAAVMVVLGLALSLRVGLLELGLLAMAELIALPIAQAATLALMSQERGALASVVLCLVPAGRLVGVLSLIPLGVAVSVDAVVLMHFIGSVVGALLAALFVGRVVARPDWAARLSLRESAGRGTRYAVGSLVATSYPESDKVLILQLLGTNAAGQYTAAFRIISVFVLPISALINAALPRLFMQDGSGGRGSVLRAITVAALAYALFAAVSSVIAAPLMPLLFGEAYAPSIPLVGMLSAWIPLVALHQCGASALTSGGLQSSRVLIEAVGLVGIVALNFLLLPILGIAGAVWSLLVVEAFLASACWVVQLTQTGKPNRR